MLSRMRRPSPAAVISVVALFLAVGGGAFAVAKSDKKTDKKIATKVVHKLAPHLSVSHAKTADAATSASSATNAAHATTADQAATVADGAITAAKFGQTPGAELTNPTHNPGCTGSNVAFPSGGPQQPIEFTGLGFDHQNVARRPNAMNANCYNALVAPIAGTYVITGSIAWPNNTTGDRKITIDVGGTELANEEDSANTLSSFFTSQSAAAVAHLDAGEVVQLVAFQTSGSALALQGGQLAMNWIAP